MLTYPDAQFAARDPALPGLSVLLDTEAFVHALNGALPGLDMREAHATYLRYKAGTNCLVAYQLEIDGARAGLYAKARREQSTHGRTRAALTRGVRGSIGTAGVILEEARAAVYAFPNDRKLDALAVVGDPSAAATLLRTCLPHCPAFWNATLHDLHYKPERRYVARIAGNDGNDAVLRVYSESDYSAASRAVHAFESHGSLRVPHLLGESEACRSLVLSWLPGRSLYDSIIDATLERQAIDRVAAALAELHSQDARALPAVSPDTLPRIFRASADAIASVCPWLADRARAIAQTLASRVSRITSSMRPLHGDFSADQVVLNRGEVGIIDLDAATRGDPEIDLGSFAADLQREVVRANLSPERAEAIVTDLLDGYRRASGHDPYSRFGIYFAAALLGNAVSPFRNHLPDWPDKVEFLLARAEQVTSED